MAWLTDYEMDDIDTQNQLAGLRAANERLRKRQAEQLKKALPLAIADMATRAANDNDE